MEVIVRDATQVDVVPLSALGRASAAFAVSARIPFYEDEELRQWIREPGENLLCVAAADGRILGFFYCKIMSSHWALLDNFYVVPGVRGGLVGPTMFQELARRLRSRRIAYLSALVEHERRGLARVMRRYGFQPCHTYDWFELFL